MDYDIEYIHRSRGAVAAISKRQVRCSCLSGAHVLSGEKTPVAFLLLGPEGVTCWDAQGGHMSEAEVERLYPGALSDIRTR